MGINDINGCRRHQGQYWISQMSVNIVDIRDATHFTDITDSTDSRDNKGQDKRDISLDRKAHFISLVCRIARGTRNSESFIESCETWFSSDACLVTDMLGSCGFNPATSQAQETTGPRKRDNRIKNTRF